MRISLQEQLDELESEYVRRNREYPLLAIKGEQRHEVGEMKIERLGAAINTLAYLVRHSESYKEYQKYAANIVADDLKEDESDLPTAEDVKGILRET